MSPDQLVPGMAFTRECALCPAGSYSLEGAAECTPCAAGSYSTKGSSQCGPCPESQYSGKLLLLSCINQDTGPKAERCRDRPPCSSKDFYAVTEPCNSQGKTRKAYKMVQPAVCRTDMPGAASVSRLLGGRLFLSSCRHRGLSTAARNAVPAWRRTTAECVPSARKTSSPTETVRFHFV